MLNANRQDIVEYDTNMQKGKQCINIKEQVGFQIVMLEAKISNSCLVELVEGFVLEYPLPFKPCSSLGMGVGQVELYPYLYPFSKIIPLLIFIPIGFAKPIPIPIPIGYFEFYSSTYI